MRHRVGALQLEAAFEVRAPWTVLFGPSGSGKSTLLRILAGLVKPDLGAVTMLGRMVNQSAAGLFVPAHLRPVRWSGQQTALFPRLTVRENLALGCGGKASGSPDGVRGALSHFRLEPMSEARPHELSGGQQQRVAVVRAACTAHGRLLLLDEPFTGLDAGVREELIGQLGAWLGATPVISVTHDVGEALLLGAEVIRLGRGRVMAQGPAREVLGPERERLELLVR